MHKDPATATGTIPIADGKSRQDRRRIYTGIVTKVNCRSLMISINDCGLPIFAQQDKVLAHKINCFRIGPGSHQNGITFITH